MKEENTTKLKVSLKTKIALVILGIFLSFIFLETGLRVGGSVLLSMQEYRNRQSLKQKGSYRILCLGESTTQGEYPPFLQEILNQRNAAIKFSVIDKGLDGTTTLAILERMNAFIDKYHPDMVVTMMGINDDCGAHIPYEAPTASKSKLFFRSLRSYKLVRLLWLHILTKSKEMGLYKPGGKEVYAGLMTNEDSFKKMIKLFPGELEAYLVLGRSYQDQGMLSQAEATFKKAIEFDPKNYQAYIELGRLYRSLGKFRESEDMFKKVVELYPENDNEYVELGRCYRAQNKFPQPEAAFKKDIELSPENYYEYLAVARFYQEQGRLPQAEDIFKKAIALYPKNFYLYFGLGWFYRDQGKLFQAEDIFRKVIELDPENGRAYFELGRLYGTLKQFSRSEEAFKKCIELYPQNYRAYFELGWLYQRRGKLTLAEDIIKKAIELRPEKVNAYVCLGWLYRDQGKFSQAEDVFKKAVELNPKNFYIYIGLGHIYREDAKFFQAEEAFKKAIEVDPANKDYGYAALSVLYGEMGKPQLANEYADKVNMEKLRYYNPVTVNSYRQLRDILDKRGIKYVCVQYPMNSIEPLKKIFEGNEQGIIFVDNERIFRDAVSKGGYSAYFRDVFGGNFGHCTEKGNRLLSENIANGILRAINHK